MYSPLGNGRLNWYHFFIKRSVALTRSGGYQSFIVPMSLLGDQFTRALRLSLLESDRFVRIEAFPQKDNPDDRVFFDAKLPTCTYIVNRGNSSNEFRVRIHPGKALLPESPQYAADLSTIKRLDPINLPVPLVSQKGWEILQHFVNFSALGKLKDYGATPTSGEIVFNKHFREYLTDSPTGTLILRGSHIQRWQIVEEAKQGEPVYLKKDLYLKHARQGSKAFDFKRPRVVYQECAAIDNWRRIIAAYLPAGQFCGHKICYFVEYKCAPTALLAVRKSI